MNGINHEINYENQIRIATNYYEIANAMDKIKFNNQDAKVMSADYTRAAIERMEFIAKEFDMTYEQVLEEVRKIASEK